MSLTLLYPPSEEPVSLEALKAHLRITHSEDDAQIAAMGVAARHTIEARYGIAFLMQHWQYDTDFDVDRDIVLPLNPVARIDSVSLSFEDGTATELTPADYEASTGPFARIRLGVSPPVRVRRFNGVSIVFSAGYETLSTSPAELRHAICLLTAHFYENREAAGQDRVFTIPGTIEPLAAPYRRLSL